MRSSGDHLGPATAGRLGHDFSLTPVFVVQSAPPKEPETPKPKKDEKSLGTIKDPQSGAEEKIYASFIHKGLWWFNDATPSLPTEYPTVADIPLASLGKGDFTVKVTAGADKLALDGGGASVSGKDLKKVTGKTLAPSTRHDDVTIQVTRRAPGASTDAVGEVKLEVRAPHHLDLLGNEHLARGNGYMTLTSMRVFDNFGEPMPFIDVNEDFGAATLEKGASSDWKDAFAARTKGTTLSRGNAVFKDAYFAEVSGTPRASMTPKPSNPLKPLGKSKVGSFSHDWFVGSSTTGKGVHVSHHVAVFYADHAEYTSFVSPPPAAKTPSKASGQSPTKTPTKTP